MGQEAEKLEAMLTDVCQYLAKAIARDGEGATCLIEVQVSGATDEKAACQVARTIAGSSLVKSSLVVTPTGAYCRSSWTRWFL